MAIGPFRAGVAVAAQIMLVSTAMAAAALAPPPRGTMIAVSLTGASMAETVDLALANGATVDGAGRLPGSVVVDGDRARLATVLRAHGVVLIAAPAALCGA